MVENVALDLPKSIAHKGVSSKKLASKNAFGEFLNALGKTTKHPQIAQESTQESPQKTQERAKSALISNLLQSEEVKRESPKNPLDAILQRPKASATKLNFTPEIATKAQKLESQIPQNAIKKVALESQESPKIAQDSHESLESISANQTKDSAPKMQESLKSQESPKIVQDSQESPKDSTPKFPSQESQNLPQSLASNAQDSALKSSELPKDSNDSMPKITPQDLPKNFPNLGIANTLKYGAFKAFDALSLLKPSDGKKLSELIKKADELALNLQSVKYAKMAQTPLSANYFANQLSITPKIAQDSAPKNELPKLAESPKNAPLNEILAQDSAQLKAQEIPQNSAPKTESPKIAQDSALKNDSPKIAESQKDSTKDSHKTALDSQKAELPKQDSPKITQDSVQKAESPKIAESKIQDSPKLAESQKEIPKDSPKTALDFAPKAESPKNDSPKIAESKIKDSPKIALDSQKQDFAPKNDSPKLAESQKESPKDSAPKIAQDSTPKAELPKNDSPKIAESKIQDSPKITPDSPKTAPEMKPVNFKQNMDFKPESAQNQNSDFAQNSANLANIDSANKAQDFAPKETMRHFAHNLREAIQSYKPPLTRITLELQPANLGSVEVSIISQGKNIQIQLNANQNTLNLFIQNQSDLRAQLAQIGYENVAMSFSNGAQMGFSDNSGKWRYESNANRLRNNFGLNAENAHDENDIFEIMITNNYA